MNQIATNKAQSERLLKCGVPAETADIARYEDDSVSMMEWDWSTGSYGETFPAWSLGALLELLPRKIDGGYWLTIQKCATQEEAGTYYGIAYFRCQWDNPKDASSSTISTAGHKAYFTDCSLIEAVVEMIVWLISEGYLLNRYK